MPLLSKRLKLSLVSTFGLSLVLTGVSKADIFSLELEKALMSSDKIASAHQSYLSAREDVAISTSGTEWTSNLVLDSK